MSTTRPVRATAQSQRLYERAQQHLAGGVGSGTRSPRAGWAPTPIYVAEASGSHVTDVDGTTYVDYQMGQGPLILGHRPPELLAAVTRAINERGSHLALCHELEAEAADAIAARVPSIELLRLGNSGTECVQYALRFARAATGRRWWSASRATTTAGPTRSTSRRTPSSRAPGPPSSRTPSRARPAWPPRSQRRCWCCRGTTPRRSSRRSPSTATRSRP